MVRAIRRWAKKTAAHLSSVADRGAFGLLLLAFLQACSPAAPYIKQGIDLEAQGRYDEAISLYQSVIASGEASPEKMAERLNAATGGLAEVRANRAMDALRAGQPGKAIPLAREARALSPDHPKVQAVVDALVSSEMGRAADLQADHRVVEAVAVLDALLELVPDSQDVRAARDALADAFSQQLEADLREYDRGSLPGNALVASLALEALNPGRPELSQLVQDRRRELLQRNQLPVHWSLDSSARSFPDIVAALADLEFRHPFLVQRLEDEAGDGLDISLSDIEASVSETIEAGTAVRSIPVGERFVPNPRIAELSRQRDALTGQIEQIGEEIDALNAKLSAESDLAARNRIRVRLEELSRRYNELGTEHVGLTEEMAALPERIRAVDYRDVTIPVRVHRRSVRVTATYRARCVRADFPLNVRFSLWGEAVTQGQSHDALPDVGLPAESPQFELPDDALRRLAGKDLVRKVSATTDTIMNDLMVIELNRGRRSLERGEEEAAVESFVKVILGTQTPVPGDVGDFLRSRGLLDPLKIRG